ncbi:MAG: metal-dependent hydrolase family protein [Acidimicrobiia bacterium]
MSTRRMALRAALFDGVADRVTPDAVVVIDGQHISSVEQTSMPGELRFDGATLIPGLIDCHVHYLFDPDIPAGNSVVLAQHMSPSEVVLVGARNAARALAAGVTTARSAGAPHGLDVTLARAIFRGDVPGPRLLSAGRAVTITGGHGAPFGIEADTLGEMRRAVRLLVAAGADVIKVVASEAAMRTDGLAGIPEMTQEELSAVVAEAHRLRRRVLAHAQGPESVQAAVAAGVDSIEHAFMADRATMEVVARSGVALTPTLVVTDTYAVLEGLTDEQRERQRELSGLHRASVECAIELGVPIVTGTDCGLRGIGPDLLSREIELLVAHGLDPANALRAATSRAARVLGVDAEVGSVEPGKLADLVLVEGNPLHDPTVLRRPLAVIRGGRIVFERTGGMFAVGDV